jgi:hypothetical protein
LVCFSGYLLLEDHQQNPGQRQEEEKLRSKNKLASYSQNA